MSDKNRVEMLQLTILKYADVSLKIFDDIRGLGDKIVDEFKKYAQTDVIGVPPHGQWDCDSGDYNDDKFSQSDSHYILIEPVSMGLAVLVPAYDKKENSDVWVRIVVDIDVENEDFTIKTADSPQRKIPRNYSSKDLEDLCSYIYQGIMDIFEKPIRVRENLLSGKMGFYVSRP